MINVGLIGRYASSRTLLWELPADVRVALQGFVLTS